MSYAVPRPAKLIQAVTAKVVGKGVTKDFKVGKKCDVQRNPSSPGMFIIWFSRDTIAQIPAEEITHVIEYTDGREEGYQG